MYRRQALSDWRYWKILRRSSSSFFSRCPFILIALRNKLRGSQCHCSARSVGHATSWYQLFFLLIRKLCRITFRQRIMIMATWTLYSSRVFPSDSFVVFPAWWIRLHHCSFQLVFFLFKNWQQDFFAKQLLHSYTFHVYFIWMFNFLFKHFAWFSALAYNVLLSVFKETNTPLASVTSFDWPWIELFLNNIDSPCQIQISYFDVVDFFAFHIFSSGQRGQRASLLVIVLCKFNVSACIVSFPLVSTVKFNRLLFINRKTNQ